MTPSVQAPLTAQEEAEEARYVAILHRREKPDSDARRRGYDDHAAGKAFHEGPRPQYTVAALSWRIGWNARALEERK